MRITVKFMMGSSYVIAASMVQAYAGLFVKAIDINKTFMVVND